MKMTRFVLTALILGVTLALLTPPVAAASPGFVIVRWGDTLYSIAARNGTTVETLLRANGLPNVNFVYAGQRLVIPAGYSVPSLPVSVPSTTSVYTVQYGDTLALIAARFGTTMDALLRANGLYNANFIYIGQRLNIPGRSASVVPQPGNAPTKPPTPGNFAPAPTSGKWIDVNVRTQTMTAFQGLTPLKSVLVSTGLTWTPTPIGRYAIYTKLQSQTMSGAGYYLPNVPWVMYFTGAYSIHGTYWHHNFGQPMSHGCVNATIEDARWFYNWAEIGTLVVTHF